MKEECWGWTTEGHQPLSEKEELEPARGSENEPFKKQTVITQKRKEKWFKNKGMASSVKGSRRASEVFSRFVNYQMMKSASAISVEWDKKKSGLKCRVKSKSEGMYQVSPLCPSRSIPFTVLLSFPGIRQHRQIPMTPLSSVNSEPWEEIGGKKSEMELHSPPSSLLRESAAFTQPKVMILFSRA